jgi:hypothetical protein
MVGESSITGGDSRTTVVGKIASTNKGWGWENRSDTTTHAAKMKSDGKLGLANQAAPVNAPVAPRFHAGRAWRRVTEQHR